MTKKIILFVFIFISLTSYINTQVFAFEEQPVPAVAQNDTSAADNSQLPLLATSRMDLQEESVEYTLPYPGILPDHPLYFFKTVRDSMLEVFISEPAKKAELYLLQSDKHLSMVLVLVDEKKYPIAKSTLKKSSEYFQKAVSALGTASRETSGHLTSQMHMSARKHVQVLRGIATTSDMLSEAATAQQAIGSIRQKLDEMEK